MCVFFLLLLSTCCYAPGQIIPRRHGEPTSQGEKRCPGAGGGREEKIHTPVGRMRAGRSPCRSGSRRPRGRQGADGLTRTAAEEPAWPPAATASRAVLKRWDGFSTTDGSQTLGSRRIAREGDEEPKHVPLEQAPDSDGGEGCSPDHGLRNARWNSTQKTLLPDPGT